MNKNLPEYVGIKTALAAAQTGERISAGVSDRVGVLILATAATNVTLLQHTLIAAGTSKALSTDNLSYQKPAGNTVFTKTDPADGVVGNTYVIPAAGLFYIEVESSQLDTNNGFAFVSANTDVNATAIYFAIDARHGAAYSVAI